MNEEIRANEFWCAVIADLVVIDGGFTPTGDAGGTARDFIGWQALGKCIARREAA